MTNAKTTKRALFASIMSMLLCVSMLLGTTFAWFTDSAVSANNVIKSGNLDVDVQYTLDGENWKPLDGANDLFQKGLWEPGHTEVVALKIENKGSLALKYTANMNIVDETVGKTKDNKDIILSDILTVDSMIMDTGAMGDALLKVAFQDENTLQYTNTASFKNANVLGKDDMLLAGMSKYLVVKVDMAETVGNEANHNGTDIPTINFGINVLATQFTSEKDSFGSDYDENAKYDKPAEPIIVTNAEELLAALSNIEEETVIDATGVVIEIKDIRDTYAYIDVAGGVTIKGATIVPTYRGGNYVMFTAGAGEQVVFENCNFTNTGKSLVLGSAAGGPDSIVYNDCNFTGYVITNFVDNPDGVAEFNNCTFSKASSGLQNFVEGMGGTHNFNKCTFDFTGVTQQAMGIITNGCVNVYSESAYSTVVNLNNCTRTNCGTRTYGPNSKLNINN